MVVNKSFLDICRKRFRTSLKKSNKYTLILVALLVVIALLFLIPLSEGIISVFLEELGSSIVGISSNPIANTILCLLSILLTILSLIGIPSIWRRKHSTNVKKTNAKDVIKVTLIGVCILSFIPIFQTWDSYQTQLAWGMKYKENKEYNEAINHYGKAINKESRNNLAYLKRSDCFVDTSRWDEVIVDTDYIISNTSDTAKSYVHNNGTLELYEMNAEINDDDFIARTAKSQTMEVLQNLSPEEENDMKEKRPLALVNRGIAYYNKGDSDKAIEDYNEAIKLNPKYARAYLGRGIAYYDRGDDSKAIKDYDEAIQLDHHYAKAYWWRGSAHYEKGDYDKAILDYSNAIKSDPDYASAYLLRGIAYYYGQDDYHKAMADYNQAIELSPDYARAYLERGIAYYYDQDDYHKAMADYDKAIELSPYYARAYLTRGIAYYHRNDLDKAIVDFKLTIKYNPTDTEAREYLDIINAN